MAVPGLWLLCAAGHAWLLLARGDAFRPDQILSLTVAIVVSLALARWHHWVFHSVSGTLVLALLIALAHGAGGLPMALAAALATPLAGTRFEPRALGGLFSPLGLIPCSGFPAPLGGELSPRGFDFQPALLSRPPPCLSLTSPH